VLDDGQAESGAAELMRARFVDPIEPFGEPRQVVGRYADSGVGHGQLDKALERRGDRTLWGARDIGRAGADGDLPTARSVLDPIVDQVDQCLPEAIFVGVERRRAWRDIV